MNKKQLTILVGNIGAGKSTLAKKYQKNGYVVIARDMLRYSIGGGIYVFNPLYEPIILKTELFLLKKFINLGINIIVDEVGMTKSMRKKYILIGKKYGYNITCIKLPYYSRQKSVDRRMTNPHGCFDREIWNSVWEKFDSLYECPTKTEGFNKIINL